MAGVVQGMSKGLAAMDVDKISKTMDRFEQQFEDMDVKTGYMDDAMNATTATTTPAEQVDELIKMVADENNLELGEAFSEAGPVGKKKPVAPQSATKKINGRR
jgi:charged multivesicular body protein 1